jgi:hypothetical protein
VESASGSYALGIVAPEERRSLKYIRLAAWLAGRPESVDDLTMSLADVEEIVGAQLPAGARFPSWWRNDDRRMHSRAWMSAGWEVLEMSAGESTVRFARKGTSSQ